MLEERRRRCMCIPWVALQRSPSLKRESSHDQIYLNAFISPGIMYLCGSITSLAVFVTCYDFSTGSERYHNKKDQHNHKDSQSCDNHWTSINPSHTMCLKDVGTGVSLTETFKHALVQLHNDIRSHVEPHAADMTKLTWDDDLALVAEKWAKQCKTYSDKPLNRQVPSMPGVQIGQNTAYYYKDFKDAVDAWAEEKKHLRFQVGFYGGAAANYSQMVLSKAQRVGCGMASCPNQPFTHLYVCNYAYKAANKDYLEPYYKSHKSCSKCPLTCDSSGKLCDCKGKLCLNDGKLDVETCSCICSSPFTGDTCEKQICPEADSWNCNMFMRSECWHYPRWMAISCPYRCGICHKAA